MIEHRWMSAELHKHPAKHLADTYGYIVLSAAGVYCLQVGHTVLSCPQDWASKIHQTEERQYLDLN